MSLMTTLLKIEYNPVQHRSKHVGEDHLSKH